MVPAGLERSRSAEAVDGYPRIVKDRARLAPAPNLADYEERVAGSIGRGRGRCSTGCPAAGD